MRLILRAIKCHQGAFDQLIKRLKAIAIHITFVLLPFYRGVAPSAPLLHIFDFIMFSLKIEKIKKCFEDKRGEAEHPKNTRFG